MTTKKRHAIYSQKITSHQRLACQICHESNYNAPWNWKMRVENIHCKRCL